jgi:hypothetical protein
MDRYNSHPEKRFERSAIAPPLLRAAFAHSGSGFMQFASNGGGNSDLSWLNQLGSERGDNSASAPPPKDSQRNRRLGMIILVIAILAGCAAVFGLALYSAFAPNTEKSSPQSEVTCQELIDRAMQSSGDSCDQMGSNQVCYGNNTLSAELNSGENTKFANEGDVVSVADLRRLAASPLNLSSEEWGIAVFKVLANLPRSLPGETITMVIFGNTTLDNPSSNLQSFYFSSTLGQIQCDEVPFDGMMITMPDGAGVRFIINGADMTLMGNASISAIQNGSMEVSLYSGSAIISANGGTQLVTAGESTSMDLGGPNGTSAVSPPSPPQPLSPEELALACTLTGQFCSPDEITPVSPGDFLATLQVQMGLTSTPTSPATATLPPTLSPTTTLSPTPSLSATITRTGTPTRTPTRTRTPTPTSTGTLSATPSQTNTAAGATSTNTSAAPTNTPVPPTSTNTPAPPTNTPVPPSSTNTPVPPTDTPVPPTSTNTPSGGACANVSTGAVTSPNSNELRMTITNSSGAVIRMDSLDVDWEDNPASQRIIKIQLNGVDVFSGNANNAPTNWPADHSWSGSATDRDIANGATVPLLIQFDLAFDPPPPPYTLRPAFNIGCYVEGSY